MKYCVKCNAELDDDAKFCPVCGTSVTSEGMHEDTNEDAFEDTEGSGIHMDSSHYKEVFEPTHFAKLNDDRKLSIVAYIPLIGAISVILRTNGKQRSKYLSFHLNQSLVITLLGIFCLTPTVVGRLWCIFLVICWVISIAGACNGRMDAAPFINRIHIID